MTLDRDQAVVALTAYHDQLEQAEKRGLTAFEQVFHNPPPDIVGVHEIDVSRYERGEVDPSLHTLVNLARVLGVEVKDLLKTE